MLLGFSLCAKNCASHFACVPIFNSQNITVVWVICPTSELWSRGLRQTINSARLLHAGEGTWTLASENYQNPGLYLLWGMKWCTSYPGTCNLMENEQQQEAAWSHSRAEQPKFLPSEGDDSYP